MAPEWSTSKNDPSCPLCDARALMLLPGSTVPRARCTLCGVHITLEKQDAWILGWIDPVTAKTKDGETNALL